MEFEMRSRSVKRSSSNAAPRSGRMSCLLVVAGTAFISCLTLLIFNFVFRGKELEEQQLEFIQSNSKESYLELRCESEYCVAKSCITTASRLIDIMDNSTDPCQDFYEYACGGYKKKRAVRYNEDYFSPRKEALDNILVNIKRLMEKQEDEGEGEALRKTKNLYALCMNETERDIQNKQSLETWFNEIKVHLDDRLPTEGDIQLENYGSWRLILTELEKYQVHAILKPQFKMDEDSSSLKEIEIGCNVPMLSPETYLHPSEEEHAYSLMLYNDVISSMFKMLGVDSDRAKSYVDEIIKLETAISRSIKRSPNPNVPPLSVEHKQQIKEIWRPLIGDIGFDVNVTSTCEFNLERILKTINNASPENSARYIIWKMMTQLMQYMDKNLLELHQHYLERLPGSDYAFLSTWKQCTDMVREELGVVVAKGLIDEGYFTEAQQSQVREIFWELKSSFGYILRRMPFFDDVTTEVFLDKLKNLEITVGFPREYTTEDLNADFSELEINSSQSYFLNVMGLRRFKAQRFYKTLTDITREPEERVSLNDNPLGTTSSYDYIANRVRFDFGLLTPPLYNSEADFPKFLKYGQAIPMAHELSHAFDTTGMFFDGFGNRWPNLDWWTEDLKKKFQNYTQCLVTQHSELSKATSSPVSNIREAHTLNNVMADVGAFFVTYAGLSIHLQTEGSDEKPLPGISLTKKQIHFLQEAQLFCELREKPSLDHHDIHTMPPNIRINNAIMNTENFGDVFNCPVGSPMNPKQKCIFLK